MGVSLITLSGIEKDAQGAVTSGVIEFTLSSNLVDATGNIVYNAGTHHATVDPLTGLWSIVLAATKNDSGIQPVGAVWAVVKHVGAGESFSVELDAALGTPQYLADLTPVSDSTHVYGLPLTAFGAKGDLLAGTGSALYDNLTVGTNGKVLTADSAEATGLKWAVPASGVTDHGALTGLSDNDHAGVYDTAGTAASAVSTHAGLADPHPGYLTPAEGNAAYDAIGAASTVNTALSTHAARTDNPHGTTAVQLGAYSVKRKSGLYYVPQGLQAPAASMNLNTLYASPFETGQSITLDRIGIFVSGVGTAGAVTRLGIFADNGSNYPGALVLDAGTVNCTNPNDLEIAISQALTPGRYWLAAVMQAVVCTTRNNSMVQGGYDPFGSIGQSATPSTNGAFVGYAQTGQSGALPGTFSTTTVPVSVAIRVFVRVAA